MQARFRDPDDGWSVDGSKITAPEALNAIRHCLENEGPIIVEHWFYRGASAPDRFVVSDFDEFVAYLNTKASAGDSIYVWSFAAVCRDGNVIASGKCPDDDGLVPARGAY